MPLQISFRQSVCVTGFEVSELQGECHLRLYARDSCCLSGGRFIVLFDGTVSGRARRLELPATYSDHVVLQGKWEVLDLSLLGCFDNLDIQEKVAVEEKSEKPWELMDCLGSSHESFIPMGLPFENGFSESLVKIMKRIAHGEELTADEIEILFTSVDILCSSLRLIPHQQTDMDLGKMEKVHSEDYMHCARAVVARMEDVGDGQDQCSVDKDMQFLAASCLLCSCRVSVFHFILSGGVNALAGILKLRGVTALMIRYAVCASELVTMIGGSVGCDALLGKWTFGIKHDMPLPKEEQRVLHVPGIVNAKVFSDNQKTMTKIDHTAVSLPPGMIVSGKRGIDMDVVDDTDDGMHPDIDSLRHESVTQDDADSSRRKSGKKKEKKKRKSRLRSTRDRSSEHKESRQKRDDKESKKHRHKHTSIDKCTSEGIEIDQQQWKKRPVHDGLVDKSELKKPKLIEPALKKRKVDSAEGDTDCIDLRRTDLPSLPTVSLYDLLFDILLQPRPRGIVHSIKRLIDRLNLHHCLYDFQVATHELMASLRVTQSKLVSSGVFSSIANCMGRILTFTKDSMKKTTDWDTDNDKQSSQGLLNMVSHADFDVCTMEYLTHMDIFGHLKLVIQALCLSLEATDDVEIWTDNQSMIVDTSSSLLRILLSTPNGLSLLKRNASRFAMFSRFHAKGLNTAGYGCSGAFRSFFNAVDFINTVFKCCHNMEQIDTIGIHCMTAVHQLLEVLMDSHGHDVVLCALQVNSGILEKLCCILDHSTTHQTSDEKPITAEPVGALRTANFAFCSTVFLVAFRPSIIQLLFDLSRLSYSPEMIVELVKNCATIKQRVEDERLAEKASGMDINSPHLDQLLGMMDAIALCSESDVFFAPKELSALLSRQVSGEPGKQLGTVSVETAIMIFKDPFQFGRMMTFLNVTAGSMLACLDETLSSSFYGSRLMNSLEAMLTMATKVLETATRETLGTLMTGDFKNDLHLADNILYSTEFLCNVVNRLASILQCLHVSGVTVKSSSAAKSLIRAYFIVSLTPESMSMMIRPEKLDNPILQEARKKIVQMLLHWLSDEWSPSILDNVFDGSKTLSHLSEPAKLFATTCLLGEQNQIYPNHLLLLGDLFQSEWPPLIEKQHSQFLPPPQFTMIRTLLAKGLERHARNFRYLVEFGIHSESHVIRGSTVRLCVRAAGLGGGVGPFVIEPVMAEISSLIQSGGGTGDYYRTVEVLSALIQWPALKAAFVDAKLMSSISRLLHRIAADSEKEESILAICSSLLDVFSVLMDPDVCLDSSNDSASRKRTDCPMSSEVGVMLASLLANLHYLSVLEEKVLQLLKLASSLPDGQSAMIRGISRWRMAHSEQNSRSEAFPKDMIVWAMRMLQTGGLTEDSSAVMAYLRNTSISGATMDEPISAERIPAASRFKDLIQKTLENAEPYVHCQSTGSEGALEQYWRLVHAFPPHQLKKEWTKWSCSGTDSIPSKFYSSSGVLTAPLHHRGTAFTPSYQPIRNQSGSESVETEVPTPTASHSDLPPVLALPRRGQDIRKVRPGTNSSRPPSIHVDDYRAEETEEGEPEKSFPTTAHATSNMTKKEDLRADGKPSNLNISQEERVPTLAEDIDIPGMQKEAEVCPVRQSVGSGVDIPGIGMIGSATLIPGLDQNEPDTMASLSDMKTLTHPDSATGMTSSGQEVMGDGKTNSETSPTPPEFLQGSEDDDVDAEQSNIHRGI